MYNDINEQNIKKPHANIMPQSVSYSPILCFSRKSNNFITKLLYNIIIYRKVVNNIFNNA
ncbi:hypothetical protein FACS189462_0600 [Spirochaetia bacterium]|nr:hypothetical protein FACS189462_0600 [Spirochaetia bacterium]